MFRRNFLALSLVVFQSGMALTLRANAQNDSKTPNLEGGTTVLAELGPSIDSKKAKTGERVVVRVSEAVKIQGKVIFPQGTLIIGQITESLSRGKGDPESLIAIQFEKAALKGGEEMPVRLAIKAISPPRQIAAGDSLGQDPMAGTHAGTMTSPMGNGRQGSTVDRNAGSAGDASTSLGDSGQLTAESHGVYGMSGVRLAADVSKAMPTSTVSSNGKNLRLDSGTRMLLVSITEVPRQ